MQKINFQDLPSTTTPINATNLNLVQTNTEVAFGGTILWTNPSPTSDFIAQTINLSSSNYDCYEIIFLPIKDTNEAQSTGRIPKGYGTRLVSPYTGSGGAGARVRQISYVSDTSLSAQDGNQAMGTTAVSTNNGRCVPVYVIGYQTGLF